VLYGQHHDSSDQCCMISLSMTLITFEWLLLLIRASWSDQKMHMMDLGCFSESTPTKSSERIQQVVTSTLKANYYHKPWKQYPKCNSHWCWQCGLNDQQDHSWLEHYNLIWLSNPGMNIVSLAANHNGQQCQPSCNGGAACIQLKKHHQHVLMLLLQYYWLFMRFVHVITCMRDQVHLAVTRKCQQTCDSKRNVQDLATWW
jgi:hypothetical protein